MSRPTVRAVKSQSPSPDRTPKNSPSRRALHERTESHNNSRPNSNLYDEQDDQVYSKDPFPVYPSQVLAPPAPTYSFDTRLATSQGRPSQPLQNNTRAGNPTARGSYASRVGHSVSSVSSRYDPARTASPPLPRRSIERERRMIEEAALVSNSQAARYHSSTTSISTTNPSSPLETQFTDFPLPGNPASGRSIVTPPYRPVSTTTFVNFTGSPPARPRSRSSAADISVESVLIDSPNFICDSPNSSRPRSTTNPSSPANSSHQAVLHNATRLQYAQVRQAPIQLRAKSFTPEPVEHGGPQRILRKRANSNLQKSAAITEMTESTADHAAVATGSQQLDIAEEKEFEVKEPDRGSAIPPIPAEARAWITQQRTSNTGHRVSGFTEEMGDTVPELQAPPLRQQKSGGMNKTPESRPGSTGSVNTAGSFYNFLNSSISTWAKHYYRNDESLRAPETPSQRSIGGRPATGNSTRLGSATTSGPSYSPASSDFPSQIYIPRIRPRMTDEQANPYSSDENIKVFPSSSIISSIQTPPADTSHKSLPDSPPDSPPPHIPQHATRPLPRFTSHPHLGLDAHVSSMINSWQAPSYDEDLSLFSRGNRQVVLFCAGFVFPLAWILAAALPLPPRPQWRKTLPGSMYALAEDKRGWCWVGVDGDLFDPVDVRRFQKASWWRNANRFMAIVGLVVVAVMIACAVIATKHT